jgi:hypothetical protein
VPFYVNGWQFWLQMKGLRKENVYELQIPDPIDLAESSSNCNARCSNLRRGIDGSRRVHARKRRTFTVRTFGLLPSSNGARLWCRHVVQTTTGRRHVSWLMWRWRRIHIWISIIGWIWIHLRSSGLLCGRIRRIWHRWVWVRRRWIRVSRINGSRWRTYWSSGRPCTYR